MDLPDADNRLKILKIFLDQENIKPGFQLENLANATEGYSGSDLKVMCCDVLKRIWIFSVFAFLMIPCFCRTFVLLQPIDPSKSF